MTKKISVSLPDDVAAGLDDRENVSGYVSEALRAQYARESTEHLLAAAGIVSTPEGRARARERLTAARRRCTPEYLAEVRTRLGSPRA